jgi:hypothetical protein
MVYMQAISTIKQQCRNPLDCEPAWVAMAEFNLNLGGGIPWQQGKIQGISNHSRHQMLPMIAAFAGGAWVFRDFRRSLSPTRTGKFGTGSGNGVPERGFSELETDNGTRVNCMSASCVLVKLCSSKEMATGVGKSGSQIANWRSSNKIEPKRA